LGPDLATNHPVVNNAKTTLAFRTLAQAVWGETPP
jgi:hypothetical protein